MAGGPLHQYKATKQYKRQTNKIKSVLFTCTVHLRAVKLLIVVTPGISFLPFQTEYLHLQYLKIINSGSHPRLGFYFIIGHLVSLYSTVHLYSFLKTRRIHTPFSIFICWFDSHFFLDGAKNNIDNRMNTMIG